MSLIFKSNGNAYIYKLNYHLFTLIFSQRSHRNFVVSPGMAGFPSNALILVDHLASGSRISYRFYVTVTSSQAGFILSSSYLLCNSSRV